MDSGLVEAEDPLEAEEVESEGLTAVVAVGACNEGVA